MIVIIIQRMTEFLPVMANLFSAFTAFYMISCYCCRHYGCLKWWNEGKSERAVCDMTTKQKHNAAIANIGLGKCLVLYFISLYVFYSFYVVDFHSTTHHSGVM